MGVRLRRLAPLLVAFAAIGSVAFGQDAGPSGGIGSALPKHPIPYRALKKLSAKPKPKVKPAAPAAKPPGAPQPATGATVVPGANPGSPTPPTPKPAPPRPGQPGPGAVGGGASKPPAAHFPPPPVPPPPAPPPLAPAPHAPAPTAVSATPAPQPAKPNAPPPAPAPPPRPLPPKPLAPVTLPPVTLPNVTAPPTLPTPRAGARLQPGQAMPATELEAFIDGQVTRAMTGDHIAGVAVAVVQNGQLVMEKGYGASTLAQARRIDPRATLVRLGSASQIFTWLAALKAIEDGRLKLDAPVNAYLPQDLQAPDEGFGAPILFRHLMSHTAGFEDRALGRRYVHGADQLLPLGTALDQDRPRRVRAAGALSAPSDYGVALGGEIVARVEGHPFDQLIEGEILNPLGLSHTSFREPYPAGNGLPDPLDPKLAAAVVEGFHWTGRGYEPLAFSYGQSLAPAISASTTADDMARLMIALLNDGKLGGAAILKPATAVLLRTPLQHPAPGVDGWTHGLAMQRLPGGFEALSQVGTAPGFRTALFLVPGLNTGVFVVTDTDTGGPLTRELSGAVVQHFYGGEAPEAAGPAPDVDYTGAYLSAQRAYHGLEAFADRLIKGSTLALDPTGGIALSTANGTRVFEPTGGPDQFRGADGRALLTPAVDGKVRAYVLASGGGAAERVGGVHSLVVLEVGAALTALAIFASFAGLVIRDRPDARPSRAQVVARVTQLGTCVVWCVAFGAFALFIRGGLSDAVLMFDWPNSWLVTASWAALVAGVLSLVLAVQLPGAWREERRIAGWSIWRKLRHTGTVLVFLSFTAILAAWGALEPLSS